MSGSEITKLIKHLKLNKCPRYFISAEVIQNNLDWYGPQQLLCLSQFIKQDAEIYPTISVPTVLAWSANYTPDN
ncbi:hypothetical protein E2320_008276 [Naja naja]|nr:hypothetical protein E2320_008276 [Naja naja]